MNLSCPFVVSALISNIARGGIARTGDGIARQKRWNVGTHRVYEASMYRRSASRRKRSITYPVSRGQQNSLYETPVVPEKPKRAGLMLVSDDRMTLDHLVMLVRIETAK